MLTKQTNSVQILCEDQQHFLTNKEKEKVPPCIRGDNFKRTVHAHIRMCLAVRELILLLNVSTAKMLAR